MHPSGKLAWAGLALHLACSPATEQGVVEIAPLDSLYTLQAPAFLKPGYDMHDFAQLQYYSTQEGIFLLGIEDSKASLGNIKRRTLRLEDYYTFVESNVLEQADSSVRESAQAFQLADGIEVRAGDYFATGLYEGARFELFYRVAVYNLPEHFVQVVVWLPYSGACDRYDDTEMILRSLRLKYAGATGISEGPGGGL